MKAVEEAEAARRAADEAEAARKASVEAESAEKDAVEADKRIDRQVAEDSISQVNLHQGFGVKCIPCVISPHTRQQSRPVLKSWFGLQTCSAVVTAADL
jgi:hypothetical protein